MLAFIEHHKPKGVLNMPYQIEHTDTFGGEANYCWVNRAFIAYDGLSNRALVRRAKAWAGWTGHRCDVSRYGDMIEIRPRGVCQVIFINWCDEGYQRGDNLNEQE